MHRRSSSTSSSRRAERWAPVRKAIALFFVLVAAWQFLIAPRFPPVAFETDFREEAVMWFDGIGGFLTIADVEEAGTLIVGDSRIPAGVDIHILRAEGIPDAAGFWMGEVNLTRILPAAIQLDAPRVVVCISTLGLAPETRGHKVAFQEGEGPPPGFHLETPEYRAWRKRRFDELLDLGYKRGTVNFLFRYFEDRYGGGLVRQSSGPRGIDARLNSWFTHERFGSIRLIRPRPWAVSWFDKIDVHGSDHIYQLRADNYVEEEWASTRQEILDTLHRMRANGSELVFVRMPVAPSLMEIERSLVSDEELREFCREAGGRFLDYAEEPYPTHDGLHMTYESERRFSKQLAADLLEAFAE